MLTHSFDEKTLINCQDLLRKGSHQLLGLSDDHILQNSSSQRSLSSGFDAHYIEESVMAFRTANSFPNLSANLLTVDDYKGDSSTTGVVKMGGR